MSLFQPVDMTGPANRSAQIQKLAQTAAQNVMRRQRMSALIRAGAAAAGSAAGGAVNAMHSSMRARPTGSRGSILRPPMSVGGQSLAEMLASAGQRASTPGAFGGMYASGGGGFDFASLPDPNDPRQSNVDLGVPMSHDTPPAPPVSTGSVNSDAPNSVTALTAQGFRTGGPATGGFFDPSALPPGVYALDPPSDPNATVNGMLHLGGGLYYDPVTDSLRGGNPARG